PRPAPLPLPDALPLSDLDRFRRPLIAAAFRRREPALGGRRHFARALAIGLYRPLWRGPPHAPPVRVHPASLASAPSPFRHAQAPNERRSDQHPLRTLSLHRTCASTRAAHCSISSGDVSRTKRM